MHSSWWLVEREHAGNLRVAIVECSCIWSVYDAHSSSLLTVVFLGGLALCFFFLKDCSN